MYDRPVPARLPKTQEWRWSSCPKLIMCTVPTNTVFYTNAGASGAGDREADENDSERAQNAAALQAYDRARQRWRRGHVQRERLSAVPRISERDAPCGLISKSVGCGKQSAQPKWKCEIAVDGEKALLGIFRSEADAVAAFRHAFDSLRRCTTHVRHGQQAWQYDIPR